MAGDGSCHFIATSFPPGRHLALAFALCALTPLSGGAGIPAPPDSDAPSGLAPASLETPGLRVGTVTVYVEDVFDERDAEEDGPFYRLANALHRRTRERVIAQQLLFNSGDPFSRQKLEESERILRSRHYLGEASVTPVRIHEGVVDIAVRVRDVWTFNPGVKFAREGGHNSAGVELEESNLLGLGNELNFSHRSDPDRTSHRVRYLDPNFLGSWWHLGGEYSSNSDGAVRALEFGLPFYCLDSRFSIGIDTRSEQLEQPLYAAGHETGRLDVDRTAASFELGISRGLVDGWTRRFLGGVRFEDVRLAPTDDLSVDGAGHRRLAYPWLGIELIEDRFAETGNLQQIGRAEDVFLGRSLRAELGWSPGSAAFDSATLYSLDARWSFASGDEDILQIAASASGRFVGGASHAARRNVSLSAFHRVTEDQLLFGRLEYTALGNPDPETQLLLGAETGLRGYPLHFLANRAQAVATVEYRFFTDWYPFRLVRIGGAAFFDAGRVLSRADPLAGDPGWLCDFGIGLRLGNARSSHGSVIHIDLAMPLDRSVPGADAIDAVQFLVQTRTSF